MKIKNASLKKALNQVLMVFLAVLVLLAALKFFGVLLVLIWPAAKLAFLVLVICWIVGVLRERPRRKN